MKTTIGRWPAKIQATEADWVNKAMQDQYDRKGRDGGSWWIGLEREELSVEARRQITRLRNSRFGLHTNAVVNS